jgi:glycosyltransferase involved in cell wall biosynthesis
MPSARICLNMIVKDEAPVIGRCLDAALPFIDHWVIVDTGSTDGTQDLVRRHLASVPGTLAERPWRNFAHNRNEALALAREALVPTMAAPTTSSSSMPTRPLRCLRTSSARHSAPMPTS